MLQRYSRTTLTLAGITGTVSIDANGDRNADYSLLDLRPETGSFEVSLVNDRRLVRGKKKIIRKEMGKNQREVPVIFPMHWTAV